MIRPVIKIIKVINDRGEKKTFDLAFCDTIKEAKAKVEELNQIEWKKHEAEEKKADAAEKKRYKALDFYLKANGLVARKDIYNSLSLITEFPNEQVKKEYLDNAVQHQKIIDESKEWIEAFYGRPGSYSPHIYYSVQVIGHDERKHFGIQEDEYDCETPVASCC